MILIEVVTCVGEGPISMSSAVQAEHEDAAPVCVLEQRELEHDQALLDIRTIGARSAHGGSLTVWMNRAPRDPPGTLPAASIGATLLHVGPKDDGLWLWATWERHP